MKAIRYPDVPPRTFDGGNARHVTGRVVIGKDDGATHFAMRVFEIGEGGHTPRHSHAWEHEMFYHSGQGEVLCDGTTVPVQAGSVAFIPPGAEHQVRNTGAQPLVFVCLIPAGVPEL